MKQGAILIHDDKAGNVSVRIFIHEGEVERVLAESYRVEEGIFPSPEENYSMLEPYAVLANFDSTGLDIWCPNAGPHMKARPLSNAFGIPTSQDLILKPCYVDNISPGRRL